MAIFKCKMCGGTLEINHNETVAVCEYCGTKQTLPKLDDERKANLYDRANHFRRNNEFDKAMGIYEQILNDDNTDAESYWSIVLCRYGIEYVEDPGTHKRIPTVNRAQYTSIFADEDYKSAIQYADENQKEIYEAEAKAIDEIQKGILEISQKEEPFDVFICYKETDANGRRTPDSVLATELYHELTRDGFKVFFSRITLEDKLGEEYEPYIFAALNSAKVMVVLGTKPEHFNAVWVKNEWSRYLALIKNGAKKMLVPAYKDMNPYDLPEEFSHLQAQDMSKLGFMQDLVRGISKIISSAEPKTEAKETVVVNNVNTNIAPLLKRAFMFLEDGDFARADEFCEQVLNLDPECAEAYLGKLMAELRVKKQNDLGKLNDYFNENSNYQKAYRFADEKLKVAFKDYEKSIELNINEEIYSNAVIAYEKTNDCDVLIKTAELFESICGYKDSDDLAKACIQKSEDIKKDNIYNDAGVLAASEKIESLESAIKKYEQIIDWKDSQEKILLCKQKIEEIKMQEEKERIEIERKREQIRIESEKQKKKKKIITAVWFSAISIIIVIAILLYTVIIPNSKYNSAIKFMNNKEYQKAIEYFANLKEYKDSGDKLIECRYLLGEEYFANEEFAKAAITFGKLGSYKDARQKSLSSWDKAAVRETISSDSSRTVGLKSDGTVVAVGANYDGEIDVSGWKDIVAISTVYDHTVGLKSDGTVVAVGANYDGEIDVSGWKDIVAISAGYDYTVGLKSDGTVVAVGYNNNGECDVSGWKDIVAISAGSHHIVGLKSDGTVVAVGANRQGQCDVEDWKDIVAISAGYDHTVGLKSDGTVVAIGDDDFGQCDVSGWKDIVAISADDYHTVGLKSDGTVVAVGDNDDGECDVGSWKNIKVPAKQ